MRAATAAAGIVAVGKRVVRVKVGLGRRLRIRGRNRIQEG